MVPQIGGTFSTSPKFQFSYFNGIKIMTVISLDYCVSSDGVELSQMEMRRPKVADMLAADTYKGTDAQKEISMFANLCSVSPSAIEQLDLKDYRKIQEAYQDFLS